MTAAPIPVVAGFMVVVFVASMLVGVVRQYPTYSNAWANLRAFSGGCGLADDVLVEPDTNAGFLTPLPGDYGPLGPLGGAKPVGFTPNGISDTLEPAEPFTANPGTVNSDGSPNKPNVGIAYAAGTGGGYGPVGINGSRVFLPFGLDPRTTPVMGSFNENTVAAKATSAWYELGRSS